MSPLVRTLGLPFRGVAKILSMLRYDPDPYGRGSSDRPGETNMRCAEDAMRHGSVISGFSSMGNNG